MRGRAIVALVSASLLACSAFGTASDPGPDAAGVDASNDTSSDAPAACAVLVGSAVEGDASDTLGPGYTDLYGYVASCPGVATKAYVDLGDGPVDRARFGVYDDEAGAPHVLLASASLDGLGPGWHAIALDPPVALDAGVHLWLGVAATGTVRVADRTQPCTAAIAAVHGVSARGDLPTPFPTDASSFQWCNASLYLGP